MFAKYVNSMENSDVRVFSPRDLYTCESIGTFDSEKRKMKGENSKLMELKLSLTPIPDSFSGHKMKIGNFSNFINKESPDKDKEMNFRSSFVLLPLITQKLSSIRQLSKNNIRTCVGTPVNRKKRMATGIANPSFSQSKRISSQTDINLPKIENRAFPTSEFLPFCSKKKSWKI